MGFIESLRDKEAKNLQKASKAIENAETALEAGELKEVSEQINNAKDLLFKEDEDFKEYPQFPECLLKLSSLLLKTEDYDGVIIASNKAIQVDSSLEAAWYNKFQAESAKSQYDDALTSIEAIIALGNDGEKVLADHAVVLSKLGKVEEAVAEAKQLVENNPSYLPPYDLLMEYEDPTLWGTKKAEVLMNSGQSSESIQTLDYVLDHSPGDIQAMLLTADLMRTEKQYIEASKVYDEVLKIDPNSVEGNLGKAKTIRACEPVEKSIEYYKRAISNDPERNDIKLELASAFESMGMVEKAEELYKEVFAKDEKCLEAMEGVYRTVLTQNKWEEVISICYQLMQYDANIQYCYAIIDSLVKLHRLEDALDKAESALLSFPDDFGLLVKRKNISISIGINEETIKNIEAVLNIMPDDLEAMYETGVAYNAIQHYADAIQDFRKSIKEFPWRTESLRSAERCIQRRWP